LETLKGAVAEAGAKKLRKQDRSGPAVGPAAAQRGAGKSGSGQQAAIAIIFFEGALSIAFEGCACITVRRWLQPRPSWLTTTSESGFIGWRRDTEIERLMAD